jgi:REP element-mobilizing transposase RayT
MARRPRIDFPGAFHHVYARGIEKRDIVADHRDNRELRRRILINLERFHARCLAWAFLPNHFHLLFHSESGNLSDFMRCLMSGYSIYFNRRYERSGHLFQNRYKSSIVETERYLLELIRYIHLNPVRAGIVGSVETLSRYSWTGHHEIMASGRLPWEKYPFVQEFFSSRYLPGLEIYLAFLGEGLDLHPGEFPFENGEGRSMEQRTSLEGSLNRDAAFLDTNFLDVVDRISRRFNVPRDKILDGRRDRLSSRARREILRECVRERGLRRRSVCKWLGITESGGFYLLKATDLDAAGASSRVPENQVQERNRFLS